MHNYCQVSSSYLVGLPVFGSLVPHHVHILLAANSQIRARAGPQKRDVTKIAHCHAQGLGGRARCTLQLNPMQTPAMDESCEADSSAVIRWIDK